MDFLRSCSRGWWRFYPSRPDVLVPGYHYFAPEGTRALETYHSFGSAVWTKDGMIYPYLDTGQEIRAGTQWYNGQAPDLLPPDQIIFPLPAFGNDLPFPPTNPRGIGGFDARCFIRHTGTPSDPDGFLLPDVTDCCWQRVLAGLLNLLTEPYPGSLADFNHAAGILWPDCDIVIDPPTTVQDRFAWILMPRFQLVLRVGTQNWMEIIIQAMHLNRPPREYGTFATSRDWFDLSNSQLNRLNDLGWDPDLPCVFVGHSRGGVALWILARRLLQANPERRIDFLSFGIPKPGDSRMVNADGIRTSRHVIHRQDPVPLIPPRQPLFPLILNALAWVNVEFFLPWIPFPVYQITGDGWGNAMEPAGDLPLNTIIAWLTQIRNLQQIEPIRQHELSSYVAALADCCPEPVFPFTPEMWGILFGFADIAPGGGMWGGVGKVSGREGTGGIRLGGSGMPFSGGGGLALGGSGTVVFTSTSAIITEDGWFILTEGGDLILLE